MNKRIKKTIKIPTLQQLIKKPTDDELIFAMMKLNMLTQACLETHDELEGTAFYKHKFKNYGNLFKDELRIHTEENFVKIFNYKEDLAMYYSIKVDQAVEIFASLDFEELSVLSSLLAWYKQDPDRAKKILIEELNSGIDYKEHFE